VALVHDCSPRHRSRGAQDGGRPGGRPRDDLGTTTVSLYVEPNNIGSEVRARSGPKDALPNHRADALTPTFLGIVRSLCDGTYPQPIALARDAPELSAAALIRDGWGPGGAETRCRGLDDWWNRIDLDVPRLLAAIERGETHSSKTEEPWGVVRATDGSVRLLWPLVAETFRVDLPHLDGPVFVGSRYWLAIDVDARGELDDVTIRRERDPTFDAEGDEDGGAGLLEDRLDETAYGAVSWVVEEFALARADDDDAMEST
jgi:hypothetical protein